MGMYTALSLGVELKKDVPDYVTDVLRYMVGDTDGELVSHLDLKFFSQCPRWRMLLRCDSYYFDYQTQWTFFKDEISDTWFLSGVSNLKNYNNEIKEFLDWLSPFIHPSTCGFIGWTMYEEQWAPDLIMRSTKAGLNGAEDPRIFYVRTEAHVDQYVADQVAKEEPIT